MKKDSNLDKAGKPFYKKWWFWVIIAFIFIGALGGKSSNKDNNDNIEKVEETTGASDGNSKKELDVFINVKGHKEGNSVIFDIDTNLPDKTVLMLTLSKGDYNTEESFTGQEKVTIKDGKASSEGFSNKGEALSGEYDLSVSMSLPSTQEDSVREVIGENGEYMAGRLVQKSDISGDSYLKAMFEVKVDSDVAVNPTEDYLHTTFRNEETEDTVDEVPSDTVSNTQNNKEFIKQYETDIVVAASMSLEKFISGYKMSLAPQSWILAKFDDKDAVIGMTDIKYNNQEGKYIYVGTLNFDDSGKVVSATPHYIEVLGQVLGDDGYCTDIFDKIRELSGDN